jgi:hypothetical protein
MRSLENLWRAEKVSGLLEISIDIRGKMSLVFWRTRMLLMTRRLHRFALHKDLMIERLFVRTTSEYLPSPA